MPQNTLTGGKSDVCGDEAANLWVAVAALQILPARFFVRKSGDWRRRQYRDSGRAAPRRR